MQKLLLLIVLFSSVLMINFSFAQTGTCKLKVLYFHATNRCPGCMAIENKTKEVLEESFKTQVENGTIVFKSYNVDDAENKAISKKYKAYGPTLMLIEIDGKTEKEIDYTDTGFSYAKNEPDKYKTMLKQQIQDLIK